MSDRRPVALPRSEERRMCAEDGGEYRVLVAWPSEPPPPSGYPAIFLLDANASFGTLVEMVRARSSRTANTGVVPAVVVGIGYPVDGPYDRERRTFDFTEAPPEQEPGDVRPVSGTGGAVAFQAFLDRTVRPAIAADFPLDPARQTLFGHSLGGLFVVQSLVRAPDSFGSFVSISPSVWWARERLLADAASLANTGSPAKVVIAVGQYEQEIAPWQRRLDPGEQERLERRRAARRMVDGARDVANVLRGEPGHGLDVTFDLVPGEDHSSVVPIALSRALRAVLAPSC